MNSVKQSAPVWDDCVGAAEISSCCESDAVQLSAAADCRSDQDYLYVIVDFSAAVSVLVLYTLSSVLYHQYSTKK